jgi:hypothetical protein
MDVPMKSRGIQSLILAISLGFLTQGLMARAVWAQPVAVRNISMLLQALDRVQAGQEIVLADGTYRLPGRRMYADVAGTAANPIVIRAENQNLAIIETNGAESAFQISAPYWVFDGLHIKVNNSSVHAYKLEGNGQYATIKNGKIELDSPAEGGIKGAGNSRAPQPDHALIENNEIWFTSPTRNNNCEGIDAVAVKGWVIRKNVIHDIQKSSQGFDGIGWGVFTKGNSQDTIIEGNLIYDSFVSISFGGGGTGAQFFRDGDTRYEERNGIIRNNIVLNSGDVAVYLNEAHNARIYNNTFYNSFTSCGAGCSSIDVRFAGSTADIRNNILDKGINDRNQGSHSEGSNLMLANPTDASWFVDLPRFDLHLRPNTPAIDQGETLALVNDDFYGEMRPQGAGFDIGAAEFLVAPPMPSDAGHTPAEDAGLNLDSGLALDSGSARDAGSAAIADADTSRPDQKSTDSSRPSSIAPRTVQRDDACTCSSAGHEESPSWKWLLLLGFGLFGLRLKAFA